MTPDTGVPMIRANRVTRTDHLTDRLISRPVRKILQDRRRDVWVDRT